MRQFWELISGFFFNFYSKFILQKIKILILFLDKVIFSRSLDFNFSFKLLLFHLKKSHFNSKRNHQEWKISQVIVLHIVRSSSFFTLNHNHRLDFLLLQLLSSSRSPFIWLFFSPFFFHSFFNRIATFSFSFLLILKFS